MGSPVRHAPGPEWLRHPTRSKRPGQAVFEFVLVLSIFIAFIMMVVDFSLWMYAQASVANAAREGARYAAVLCGSSCNGTQLTTLRQRVLDRSGGMVHDQSEVDIWWRDRDPDRPAGSPLLPGKGDSYLVRVTHGHPLLFAPGNPIMTIVSCAEMRLEADDLASTVPLGTAAPHLDC
jgi:Flp pilus assembly protein TadG